MTRKHYEIMAQYVRNYRQQNKGARHRRTADAIMNAFADIASQCYTGNRGGFDRDRFTRACEPEQTREQERLLP